MYIYYNIQLSINSSRSDLNGGGACAKSSSKVPVQDQQTALALLLELAVQRGSLSHILNVVLLLLNLWNNSRHEFDNRISSNLLCAPLVPFIRHFCEIQSPKGKLSETSRWDEVS